MLLYFFVCCCALLAVLRYEVYKKAEAIPLPALVNCCGVDRLSGDINP